MTPREIFETKIAARLSDPDQKAELQELDATYQFHVTGDDGGDWALNLRDLKLTAGTDDAADCTVTIAGTDFVDLYTGAVQGAQLFMQNKLQISGNMSLAMKLGSLFGG